MDLKYEDGELKLIPENEADRAKIAAAFGEPQERSDSSGAREFCGPAYGDALTQLPDGSVNVGVRDAWWNHDPEYD